MFDETTGLMWQQGGSSEEMVYIEAAEYIIELNQKRHAGFNDWRLPTLSELKALTTGTEAVSSGNMRAFTGVQSFYYWSSTTSAYHTDYAWGVALNYGPVYRDAKSSNCGYVWPVRGGQ